ncbi:unnamed protein product, partial [Didymodactylos carnosus]
EASLGGDASGNHNIQNPSLMFISACVNKSPMKLMIDTGATNTLITEKALLSTHHKKFTSKYPWKLFQADGQTPLEVVGVVQLQIQIKSTNTNISAYVVKHLCTPCLLGTDYINKYKFKIDAGAQTITIINNKDEIATNIIKHSHSIRLPVRLINPVIVPPYENRNVLVSTEISIAITIFQPSFKLIQRLKNAPPTFQRVLSKLLEDCRQFYQVLSRLHRANFQLNPLKCAIARTEIDYLGHRVTHTGISPLPEKIASILLLKEPKTLKEANKFLGALSWYRKFIPRFVTTAAPIHAVTNLPKNLRYKFKWSQQQSD